MKRLEYICFRIIFLLINPNIIDYLRQKKQSVYSRWIKLSFASCGDRTVFGGFSRLIGAKYVHIKNDCAFGKNVVLEIWDHFGNEQVFKPYFEMGSNSSIGDDSHVTCINKIKIGNNVRIGRKTFISDNAHGASVRELLDIAPNHRPLYSKGPVIIEDCVWIGEMSCILPGIQIGKGTIIGANSVVTHDIPPYCMAAGNPAKVIKVFTPPTTTM